MGCINAGRFTLIFAPPISMDFCSDRACGVTPAAPNTIFAAAAVAALLAPPVGDRGGGGGGGCWCGVVVVGGGWWWRLMVVVDVVNDDIHIDEKCRCPLGCVNVMIGCIDRMC